MPLILGLIAVGAVILLLKWYGDANVKQLKGSLKWTGLLLGLMVVVMLAVTGKLGAAMGMVVALMAWVTRVFGFVQTMRHFGGMFGGATFGRGAGQSPDGSDVSSAFLRMKLDHASGTLDGEVLHGRFKGRALGNLSHEELRDLHAEVGGDADSRNLLEAYLDRRWPDWRETGPQPGAPPSTLGMDQAEALRILGLQPGASEADIKASHRRLMGQVIRPAPIGAGRITWRPRSTPRKIIF